MLRIHRTSLAAIAIGLAPLSVATAQDALLEIHFAGMNGWEPSAKDARVMGAISLLGERLGDFEQEFDLEPEEGELIRLAWDMLSGASALRVETSDEAPVALAFASRPSGDGGGEVLRDRLIHMMRMGGVPLEIDDSGGALFETPMGPASLQMAGEGEGSSMQITMGRLEPVSLDVTRFGLDEGVTPVMSFHADMPAISEMLFPFMFDQDPSVAAVLSGIGLFGPDAPTIDGAVGVTDDSMQFYHRMSNARAFMANSGATPEATFSARQLRGVPVDAVRAYASPFSLAGVMEMMETNLGESPIDQIGEQLGVDLRHDVIENLGPRAIAYQADSTGGGGLLSTVVIAEVRDPAAFSDAHAKVIEQLNGFAAAEAKGYVRIAARERGGVEVFTLETPGLPIPLELSWSVAGSVLVMAATPSGLDAALAQLNAGTPSILDNEAFREAVGGRVGDGGFVSMQYTDTPRLARRGYGLANLLTSAIANGVRSPGSPDRVASPLMPSFGDFVEGVRPFASVSVWDGDDVVTHAIGDRSMLVNIASAAATLNEVQGIIVPAFAAGTMLPALGQARSAARELQSAAQVRGVMQGVIIYGVDNDERMPESFDVLIEAGIIAPEMLESPFGPAGDGGPDIAVWFDLPGERAFSFESDQIVALDRAMLLATGYETNVAFADNHVEKMSMWELEDYLALDKNQGAREALGIGDF